LQQPNHWLKYKSRRSKQLLLSCVLLEWNGPHKIEVSHEAYNLFSAAFGKYCDGNYSVLLTAKNSAFPAYTQTFTATIAVKYDCLYLKNNA
jgi:hypothetical protein